MTDEQFFDSGLTVAVERTGDILYSSGERGIKPLVALIDSGIAVDGATARDKIVGRAAAFLYVLLGVAEVRADVMSAGGAEVLGSAGIAHTARTFVSGIINRRGDGPCPMEDAVKGASTAEQALLSIRERMRSLAAKKGGSI